MAIPKWGAEPEKILQERFGKDTVVALATTEKGAPQVRYVNAYYEEGAFYVITYGLSNKMRQLSEDPRFALAGDWFTAHGTGENLGWFCKPENAGLAEKLRNAFTQWIDNGHNDFDDENTCILKLTLTDGVLASHGTWYQLDFK